MKLLWVKAGGLVPLNVGGKIRSFQLLKALAERHEITLFTFYAAHPDDQHRELDSLFDRVRCMPLDIPTGRGPRELLTYARHLLSRQPFAFSKYCKPEVAESLRHLVAESSFDVIVCDFLVPAPVIPWDAGCPKVVFTHNVEAAIWRRHLAVARNPLWKLACWREFRTTDHAERHYLGRADHVIAVSDADRDTFSEFISPAKITVVPTGVDLEYFQPGEAQERPHRLVFTGAMDWMPNEDAVSFFAESILPLIRERIPEIELFIVGRNPTAAVRALDAAHAEVTVTGEVDDIRPFVHESPVYIVPLRVGGGTRLKIFEAMAMGKAIVSTTIGAEGLPVENGQNVIIADEPGEFARQVVTLLENRGQRERIGSAARELVEKRYSWNAASRQFEHALNAAVEVRRDGATGKR